MADYEKQTDTWLTRLQIARNYDSVNYAWWKLQDISKQRWDFDVKQDDPDYDEKSTQYIFSAKSEMQARVGNSESNKDGPKISRQNYEQWLSMAGTRGGTDGSLINSARSMLMSSDNVYFQGLANARNTYLNEHQSFIDYDEDYRAMYDSEDDSGSDTVQGETIVSGGGSSVVDPKEETNVFKIPDDTSPVIRDVVTDTQSKDTGLKQDPDYLDKRPAWVDKNIEYKRRKTVDGFVVDSAIIKRYYSVIDAEIYFGNEYVEDIHDISWSVRQNVTPLFGYNSYTYDEVARGNRTIFGSFTINFTSPNYLFSILEAANKANVTSVTSMTSYTVPKLASSVIPSPDGRTFGSRERGHHACMWPQTFDIDVIFGEQTGISDPVHIIILGCAIQSCQMALSASAAGAPPAVMEQYSFIAQDIKTVVVGKNDQTGDDITDGDNGYYNIDDYNNSTKLKDEDDNDDDTSSQDNNDSTDDANNSNENDPQTITDKIIADKRQQLKDAYEFATVTFSNGDDEGNIDVSFTRDTGKNVSDERTRELLARFSALFPDNNNTLTVTEQKELAEGIKAAEEKGEYFLVDNDEDSLLAFRYTVKHDGEIRACISMVDVDGVIVNALEKGEYYLLTPQQKDKLFYHSK